MTVTGLCIGSFLNVVIYRLPREQSLRVPLWSFCPHCRARIAWHDNLPLISFLMLRGRCRSCRGAIATRYPAIEAGMALVVLMLVDAFFIGHSRPGMRESTFGLTEQLAWDWPMLLGHVVLFACLLSMSAIDLEHYWVDVRFTNLATLAGFVLHALWTPRQSKEWIRPFDTTSLMSFLAIVGLGLVWLMLWCQPEASGEEDAEEESGLDGYEEVGGSPVQTAESPAPLEPSRAVAWLIVILLGMLFAALLVSEVGNMDGEHWLRALVPLIFCFLLIVGASRVTRESDDHIVAAIEAERHTARGRVLWELCLLLPAVVGAGIGYWLMRDEAVAARVGAVLHGKIRVGAFAMMHQWEPLYGLATAASGYILAGAMGWAVRIVFTLMLGREAFGTGDIHMMAAAGCIAGWPVVAIGFFLTCGVSIAGWLISLKFRRTRALPLGPWLSLSLLAVVVFLKPILDTELVSRMTYAVRLLFF